MLVTQLYSFYEMYWSVCFLMEIHSINHFRAYDSMAVSTFILLFNYHLYVVPNIFIHPEENPILIKQLFPMSPFPPTPGNQQVVFCLYGFTYTGYFIQMGPYTMWPLCLASFTEHNVFQVHLHGGMNQYSIPFFMAE